MAKRKKTFYVTTPIYYPSGNLHIGHVYTTTLAWVLRNYKKLRGYDTFFVTGADEHGQKIEQQAKNEKILPQQYVDKMHQKFVKLWTDLKIDYDFYSRTSNNAKHFKTVQTQFANFNAQNLIYQAPYQGLYSVQDEEFITINNAIKKDNQYFHPESGHLLEKRNETTYFLKVSKFQTWLEKYYQAHHNFILPIKIKTELKQNFLAKGLLDLSISRSNFTWGIPIEPNSKHIIYVWFDALHSYLSALGYHNKADANFQKFWVNGDEIVHLVGREIARFHCIYWPIMLEASKLRQPTTILSHGWIITPEGKMSKSKGNVIDPQLLLVKYDAEQIKYFFASQIHIGQDGVFNETTFKNTINADLANNYGNLLARTISMVSQNFDKPIIFNKNQDQDSKAICKTIIEAQQVYQDALDQYQIDKALTSAINLSKKLNGFIDLSKPWTLKNDLTKLASILNILLNGLYAVSTMLSIVIPEATKKAQKQLNVTKWDLALISDFTKFDNIKVQKGDVIFERIK